jgi:hypothetical protein
MPVEMPAMFILTYYRDGFLADTIEIAPTKDRITIGRSPKADHVIPSKAISRIHCTLTREGDEWTAIDGSEETGLSSYGIFSTSGIKLESMRMEIGSEFYLINSFSESARIKRVKEFYDDTGAIDRDATVSIEVSTRVLIESLKEQTVELRETLDRQANEHADIVNNVWDEVKRLKTDLSCSLVVDVDRDKKIGEMRTLTKSLAIVLGCSGLWLLVKDQQAASNIAGVVIMVGGAIGWGRSGKD